MGCGKMGWDDVIADFWEGRIPIIGKITECLVKIDNQLKLRMGWKVGKK